MDSCLITGGESDSTCTWNPWKRAEVPDLVKDRKNLSHLKNATIEIDGKVFKVLKADSAQKAPHGAGEFVGLVVEPVK